MSGAYLPLLSSDESLTTASELEKDPRYRFETNSSPSSDNFGIERAVLILSLIFNVLLVGLMTRIYMFPESTSPDPIWGVDEPLYSPAQNAIKYERKVFSFLGAKTIYNGPPTNVTDQAWYDLFPVGLTRITKAEADLLPNKTEPIPGDEHHYIISLDVFHQLHCLNAIRRALSPDVYGPPVKGNVPDSDNFDHVDHCVNSIRESLMCSADITPNVWQWDEKQQLSFPRLNNVHTCRDWDSILAWAEPRALLEKFNDKIHVLEHHH